MKATLVKFPYTVNTGDECKGPRPRTYDCHAILFEDGAIQVLFLQGTHDRQGAFFRVTDVEGARPKIEGDTWDYRVPETAVTRVGDVALTEDQVRLALTMPMIQDRIRSDTQSIRDVAKFCGDATPRLSR